MARAVQMVSWDQTSILWSTIANANRDPKVTPRAYSPADIHPFRTAADFKSREGGRPDWGTIAQLKRQYKVTRLTNLAVKHGS
jgi:hypothetical protein